MAKLEARGPIDRTRENVVMIPGGPGLGPLSFSLLDNLNKDFNVFFFYPSGTEGTLQKTIPTYNELILEMEETLFPLKNLILCGHSFGGIQAVELAVRNKIDIKSVICISAPFSNESFSAVENACENFCTGTVKALDEQFVKDPTDKNHKERFIGYAPLYFHQASLQKGIQMLRNENMSAKNLVGAGGEGRNKFSLLEKLKSMQMENYFLAGVDDQILPWKILKADANKGGFKFDVISDAGHFVHFDNPNETLNKIREFIYSRRKL